MLNQYLVKTGKWIHADIGTPKNNQNLRKDSLSSSQVIKLALLPDKKNEILKEINNATKSSLTRKASVLRSKARSSNRFDKSLLPTNDLSVINQAESSHSLASLNASTPTETTSQSSSNLSFGAKSRSRSIVDAIKFSTSIITEPVLPSPKQNLTFDLKKQHSQKSILSKQSSFVDSNNNERTPRNTVDKHFQFASYSVVEEKERPVVKLVSDNDIDSITSSDMDNASMSSEMKSPLSDRSGRHRGEAVGKRLANEALLGKEDSVSKMSRGSNQIGDPLDSDDTFLQMDVGYF